MNTTDTFAAFTGEVSRHNYGKALHYYAKLSRPMKVQAKAMLQQVIDTAKADVVSLRKMQADIASADRANGIA